MRTALHAHVTLMCSWWEGSLGSSYPTISISSSLNQFFSFSTLPLPYHLTLDVLVVIYCITVYKMQDTQS